MWRRCLRWVFPLFLAATLSLPAARAQPKGDASGTAAHPESRTVVASLVAVLSALIVLFLVCKPTRKR